MANTPYTSTGHGHVWPRPDGVKARCGGTMLGCVACKEDARILSEHNKNAFGRLLEMQNGMKPLTFETIHNAYMEVTNAYGRPKALKCDPIYYKRLKKYFEDYAMDNFMQTDNIEMLEKPKLDPKATVFGMEIVVDSEMEYNTWRLVDATEV